MEIMLVSPMRPFKIVVAKAVPYLLLSIVNVTSILLLSVFVLDVPINGSLFLLIFGKYIVYVNLSCVWVTHLYQNRFAANGHVHCVNGNVPANDHVEWLYVPHREHAAAVADNFKYSSGQMVLLYRKRSNDKGAGYCSRVERNINTNRYAVVAAAVKHQELQNTTGLNYLYENITFSVTKGVPANIPRSIYYPHHLS